MLTREENEMLTQVGRGKPAGEMLRRYWMPVACVGELTDEKPIKAFRLLGEDLVIYCDRKGRYGVVGEHCPHRSASLAFWYSPALTSFSTKASCSAVRLIFRVGIFALLLHLE